MAVMTSLHVPFDGWTVDDLPEDVDFRYELVDGALLVSPPPRVGHQDVSAQLLIRLAPLLTEAWRCAGPVGVYFDQVNYREPDLAVFRRSALEGDRLQAADVLLALEVMSPSSITNDRIAKPAQYAASGIPNFWRLELDPLVLFTYVLETDVYREAGRFTDDVLVEEPFPLRFRLAELIG